MDTRPALGPKGGGGAGAGGGWHPEVGDGRKFEWAQIRPLGPRAPSSGSKNNRRATLCQAAGSNY